MNGLRPEDTSSVGTRISWGAVLAGVVVTLALYLVLAIAGTAIGLTVGGWARAESITVWAMAWATFSTCVALFCGGAVTSQLTAGETKTESVVHGVILWGTVVAVLLWMTATGGQAGFNSMLGAAAAGARIDADRIDSDLEATARRAGLSSDTIDKMKGEAQKARDQMREATDTPNARSQTADQARKNLAYVTYWALFGMLLSMGAAIGGAYCCSTPEYRSWLSRMGHGAARHGGVERRETVQV